MFQEERIREIFDYIGKKNRASVSELGKKFSVSKVTIRRDLDMLAEKGLIVKTHGGAIPLQNKLAYEIPYREKSMKSKIEKQDIGKKAATLIKDNDIVILDSGSTTLEIVKRISQKNVTVVTNDINIAFEAANNPGIELIVAGGKLVQGVYTLLSEEATQFFKKLHVNKTFLGCDAVDIEFGISNRLLDECNMKLAMIDAAIEVIMITDSSKLDTRVSYQLCDFTKIQKIAIDSLPDKYIKFFKEKNIEVIIA